MTSYKTNYFFLENQTQLAKPNADPIQGNKVQQNLYNQDLNQLHVSQNHQQGFYGYQPLAGQFAQPYYPGQTYHPVQNVYPGQPLSNGLHVYPGHPMYCRQPTYSGQQVSMHPNQSMSTSPPAHPGHPAYPGQPMYTSQISYAGQQFQPQYSRPPQHQQNGSGPPVYPQYGGPPQHHQYGPHQLMTPFQMKTCGSKSSRSSGKSPWSGRWVKLSRA